MKLRSRSGSPIIFQMAIGIGIGIGIGIAISIFDKDRDCDRYRDIGDRCHVLFLCSIGECQYVPQVTISLTAQVSFKKLLSLAPKNILLKITLTTNVFNRDFQSVFFNCGQNMELTAFYFIKALTKAITYNYINRSQRHLLATIENN